MQILNSVGFSSLDMFLVSLFLLCVLTQLYFYFFEFIKLAFYKEYAEPEYAQPVSVIIAAKNEAVTLQKFLPTVLNQHYPLYEVIVVNNNSTDNTNEILKNLEDPKLEVCFCKEEGKRNALKVGIEKARFEHLIFIDADCEPSSELWLRFMAGKFSIRKQIVLGFGGFFRENTLINKLIRFEGVLNATQYFSSALSNKTYMGVGRNLAYTKGVFSKVGGFEVVKGLSGDDDLMVNQMATSNNVAVCISDKALTLTEGEVNWRSLFFQKRRQLTAGNYYKTLQKLALGLFGATNFLYYLLLVIILVRFNLDALIIGIFVFKQFVEYLLFRDVCKKLKNEDIPLWIPILEPIYLVFITSVGVSTWIWKVNKWK